MKTREKILLTALVLFNDEGEQNVTTVDIANEMDISPGNLYYHFKGKESIIDALYDEFESDLSSLLYQSVQDSLSLEDKWYFIYVIFEEIYQFRFFYLNLSDLLQRYPDIQKRFRRLVAQKVKVIEAQCLDLMSINTLKKELVDSEDLAENIAITLLYWFPYQALMNKNTDPKQLIHKGVYHVLSLMAPYIDSENQAFALTLKALYKSNG